MTESAVAANQPHRPRTPTLTLVDAAGVRGACAVRTGLLTQREQGVLTLLADGLSTREVAMRMSYSERTIKKILQDLSDRLHLRNRTHAVAYALRSGWL